MLAFQLHFLTPAGGLVALAALVPLAAWVFSSFRHARGRALLGLASPRPERTWVLLCLIPLLLGLAASQPALRSTADVRLRTDAQAIFVFDTSGSMAASAGATGPSRFRQAQAAAIRLRGSIPDVSSGVASMTTQVLPLLFPTSDRATFDSTVQSAIGIERPPPPLLQYGMLGTSFESLAYLRGQGYFAPSAKQRLLVLLTDGESGPYDAHATATALTQPETIGVLSGTVNGPDPPISLAIVRVGGPSDRIYESNGTVDPVYRPAPQAANMVSTLATLTRGGAYTTANLGQAAHGIRTLLGRGKEIRQGTRTRMMGLGRYAAIVAIAAIGILVWKRNLAAG